MADLASAPPSNAYLSEARLRAPEKWFPLRVLVCQSCWLAQTEDFTLADELFDADYAYFSGFSSTWLEHCRRFVESAIQRFQLGSGALVVEVAANDGYLLQFVKQHNIECLGVEPTAATAAAARAKGITIVERFFGAQLAGELVEQGRQADLIIGNNVLAHVPDINDFLTGISLLLKPEGVVSFEFPHLRRLLAENQFDTIYHEHFSYLSLSATQTILRQNGLAIFDVEELPTHGGSLRVLAQPAGSGHHPRQTSVDHILQQEAAEGMLSAAAYTDFQQRILKVKDDFVAFLLRARQEGKRVGAYGAAAKGNTLMNFAGVRSDWVAFVADRNPAKQGKWMPGSRVPIVSEDFLKEARPDYIVIFPWNLRQEVAEQLGYVRDWGGRFVTAVPELTLF